MVRRSDDSDLAAAWGFQDAAKALRETFKLLDDLARRFGVVHGYVKARQRKRVATDLAYLHFQEGGSLKNLQRIASGKFDRADIDGIRARMHETSDGVDQAIMRLGGYQRLVREEVGFHSMIRMERLINGQRGKRTIRDGLMMLAHVRSKKEAEARAQDLISMIEDFNNGIVELHDTILKERAQKEK